MKGIKIYSIVLIIGAVFSCSAPFLHMLYPKTNQKIEIFKTELAQKEISLNQYKIKKKPFTFFGYDTHRKFWYAIGKPFAMLYLSLTLLFSTKYISHKELKKILRIISFIGLYISVYFVIWAFWYRNDFSETLYYLTISVLSLLVTYISFLIINVEENLILKIRMLTNFIVFNGKSHVSVENKKAYIIDYMKTFKKLTK